MKLMLDLVRRHKQARPGPDTTYSAIGIPSVCSAHPVVIAATLRECAAQGRPALIEATSNQVNQDGGYTGMTPLDFRRYVQQMAAYPRDYLLPERNLPERIVETVERLEEDFLDRARKFEPFRAVVDVGEAIPVGTHRDRSGEGDPIMDEVRRSLQSMIDAMAAERTPV